MRHPYDLGRENCSERTDRKPTRMKQFCRPVITQMADPEGFDALEEAPIADLNRRAGDRGPILTRKRPLKARP